MCVNPFFKLFVLALILVRLFMGGHLFTQGLPISWSTKLATAQPQLTVPVSVRSHFRSIGDDAALALARFEPGTCTTMARVFRHQARLRRNIQRGQARCYV